MSDEEIDDEEIHDEKIIRFGGDVASQLLGYLVRFTYYKRSYDISPFVKVSLKKSVSYTSSDSYFNINFKDEIGPSYSFGQFNISSKAEKLGIKLKGLVDEGEIFINYDSESIEIAVNVTKIRYQEYDVDFSVIIEFDLYKYKKYLEALQKQEEREKQKKNEDVEKLKKAIGAGAAAAGAIVIAKIIKGGIGALLGGPIGAAIGFAS